MLHKHKCLNPKSCHLHPTHVCECGARTNFNDNWIEKAESRYNAASLSTLLYPRGPIQRIPLDDLAYLVEELMDNGQYWKANVVRILAMQAGYTAFLLNQEKTP